MKAFIKTIKLNKVKKNEYLPRFITPLIKEKFISWIKISLLSNINCPTITINNKNLVFGLMSNLSSKRPNEKINKQVIINEFNSLKFLKKKFW